MVVLSAACRASFFSSRGSLLAFRADGRARLPLSRFTFVSIVQDANHKYRCPRLARRVRRRLGALSLLSLIDGRAALFPLPAPRARRGRQASALETRVHTARRHYARPFPSPDIIGPRASGRLWHSLLSAYPRRRGVSSRTGLVVVDCHLTSFNFIKWKTTYIFLSSVDVSREARGRANFCFCAVETICLKLGLSSSSSVEGISGFSMVFVDFHVKVREKERCT